MRPLCTVFAVAATRSGYGVISRQMIRMLLDTVGDKYDIKIFNAPWGNCPMNALEPGKDDDIISRLLPPGPIHLPKQPDIHIHIGVPNELQAIGKFNILYTAGMETTLISRPWIEGCNRAQLVITTSKHSTNVFKGTEMEEELPGGAKKKTTVTTPVETMNAYIETDIFKKIDQLEIPESIRDQMVDIKEKFCFLFVGQWLKGGLLEDRKNIAFLIRAFCETFKNTTSLNRPALILKTSGATFSIIDREQCLAKIRQIRELSGPSAPNIYLLHGDLTEQEMNGLYNHPKVKVNVSFTAGEGANLPTLEFCVSAGKPLIISGWSAHLDYLNPDEAVLVPGELKQIPKAAVWDNVIIPESQWFYPDPNASASAMMWVFKHYGDFELKSQRLSKKNAELFNYDSIKKRFEEIWNQYVPEPAVEIIPNLPSIKKLGSSALPKINLPTLQKL